jgi:hypothetical protein
MHAPSFVAFTNSDTVDREDSSVGAIGDELRLMIDPIVLGGGKSIFRDDGARRQFRLVDGQVTGTGAILARCAPAA